MYPFSLPNQTLLRIFFLAAWLYLPAGCAIKLVDDYSSATFEETIRASKLVDRFYGDLLETAANKRGYNKFSTRYVDVEIELRSLHLRNKARPLNTESVKIAHNILDLWLRYKQRHRIKNTYSDGNAKLDRNRFTRMFTAALDAEQAKKQVRHND